MNSLTKLLSSASLTSTKFKKLNRSPQQQRNSFYNPASGNGKDDIIINSPPPESECDSSTYVPSSDERRRRSIERGDVCDKACQADMYNITIELMSKERESNTPPAFAMTTDLDASHSTAMTNESPSASIYRALAASTLNSRPPSVINRQTPFSQHVGTGKNQILLIDRDRLAKNVLQSILPLDRFSIKYMKSTDLPAAIQYLKDCEVLPDIMMLDIDLLGDEGPKFVHQVRAYLNRYVLPIVVTASSKHEEMIYELMDHEINDFIIKPFRFKEVSHRINNIIQMKKFLKKDSILSDILPANIVYSLEHGESFVTQYHKEVTILFSDICQYTVISSTWPPRKIIHMLNTMFTAFDDICLANAVYKVETIGDAYMIASGHDSKTDHIDTMIRVAMEMIEFVALNMSNTDPPIQIRIGIHTGEAYSGVIGKIRPRFCFFGDTVNTASRMESHGSPALIQISKAVYDLITPAFRSTLNITHCGAKPIKGKGLMETYMIDPESLILNHPPKFEKTSVESSSSCHSSSNNALFAFDRTNAPADFLEALKFRTPISESEEERMNPFVNT